MVADIFGTIVAAILASAVAVDNGEVTGRAAAAILIAIGIALVNVAHVVGLTLMESVRLKLLDLRWKRDAADPDASPPNSGWSSHPSGNRPGADESRWVPGRRPLPSNTPSR
jgi:hypothetical protein